MKSLRYIALKLAAVSEKDRRWLLAQLSADERNHLLPELGQVLKLSSTDLLTAIRQSERNESDEIRVHNVEAERFGSIAPERLVPVLAMLPAACTALVMEKSPANKPALEASLTEEDRRTLARSLAKFRNRVSPQFEALLMDRLCKAAATLTDASGSHRSSAFDAVLDS